MEQLAFEFTGFERFEADKKNVYFLGSPEYEKKVQDKINYILSDGSKKTVSRFDKAVKIRGKWFRDVPQNIHLKTIFQMPYTLRADDIDVNIATQNEIEKKLLEKVGKTYLVACYRLWREKKLHNLIWTGEYKIAIISCGWNKDKMEGRVSIHTDKVKKNENCIHVVSINEQLDITYPRSQFEHCNVPWQISLNKFNEVLQSEKKNLWDLMVKLNIEIPEVK